MGISKRSLETSIDLVEIKLSCTQVYDREDCRELAHLQRCLGELRIIIGSVAQGGVVRLIPQSPAKGSRTAI